MILSRTYWTHFAVTEGRGVARIFQRGVTDRDTIRGSPTIYALYRCSPSCISGLSGIIAAWRPILTKDKSHWRKYFTKKQILKKQAFNNGFYGQDIVMAFSPSEYCRLFAQKKAYRGGWGVIGTPGFPPPPSYAPGRHNYLSFSKWDLNEMGCE